VNELPLTGSYRTRRVNGFPSLTKAELSKLRSEVKRDPRQLWASKMRVTKDVSFSLAGSPPGTGGVDAT